MEEPCNNAREVTDPVDSAAEAELDPVGVHKGDQPNNNVPPGLPSKRTHSRMDTSPTSNQRNAKRSANEEYNSVRPGPGLRMTFSRPAGNKKKKQKKKIALIDYSIGRPTRSVQGRHFVDDDDNIDDDNDDCSDSDAEGYFSAQESIDQDDDDNMALLREAGLLETNIL